MVPPIVFKEERDEEMAENLRSGLKKRQHKHFSKFITIKPPPSKRPCPEILYPKLVLAIPSVSTPLVVVVGNNLPTKATTHPKPRRPSSCPAQLSDYFVEYVASIPPHPQASCVPIWEKIVKLMKQIHSFIEREAPMHNIKVLFLAT